MWKLSHLSHLSYLYSEKLSIHLISDSLFYQSPQLSFKTIYTEAVSQKYFLKTVLLKILQNLQGNICATVSFLIKLQAGSCNYLWLWMHMLMALGCFKKCPVCTGIHFLLNCCRFKKLLDSTSFLKMEMLRIIKSTKLEKIIDFINPCKL